MSAAKAVLAFLVGRPLIAIGDRRGRGRRPGAGGDPRQKTPVTHREQRVSLTDAQQMQLGSQEYAKTLRARTER